MYLDGVPHGLVKADELAASELADGEAMACWAGLTIGFFGVQSKGDSATVVPPSVACEVDASTGVFLVACCLPPKLLCMHQL